MTKVYVLCPVKRKSERECIRVEAAPPLFEHPTRGFPSRSSRSDPRRNLFLQPQPPGFSFGAAKYQRRHYEETVRHLLSMPTGRRKAEAERYIRLFQQDNPRFREDFFRAALQGQRRERSDSPQYERRHFIDRVRMLAERGASDREIEAEIARFQQASPGFKPERFRRAFAKQRSRSFGSPMGRRHRGWRGKKRRR